MIYFKHDIEDFNHYIFKYIFLNIQKKNCENENNQKVLNFNLNYVFKTHNMILI